VLVLNALGAMCLGYLLYVPNRQNTPLRTWYSPVRVGMTAHEVSVECPAVLRMTVNGMPVESPTSPGPIWGISAHSSANGEELMYLHFGPDMRVSRKEYLTGFSLRVRQWLSRGFGW